MKKHLLAVVLSFAGILAASGAENAASNLIQNPDFSKTYGTPAKASYWGVNFTQKGSGTFTPGAEGGVLDLSDASRHAALLQELDLPARSEAATLELKFEYRGTVKSIAGTLHALDAEGKELKVKGRNAKGTPAEAEWQQGSAVLTIPAETRKLRLALRAYGPGKIAFRQVSLTEKAPEKQ